LRIQILFFFFMGSIFKISEAASIAIHSMSVVARSHSLLNAQQIAEQTGFSKNHTSKVLQLLAKNHYLTSTRGPGGGFRLGKKAEEISLMDIYRLVEGDLSESDCRMDCPNCPVKNCIFGGLDKKFTTEFRNYMESKSLAMM